MKIVASHQPHFNPYLGYFAKMQAADVFILSNEVQFIKNGFIHRNKVRSSQRPEGWRWLTIPVNYRSESSIKQVRVAEGVDVPRKLLNVLRHEYRAAPYYDNVYDLMEMVIQRSLGHVGLFEQAAIVSLTGFCYMLGMLPSVRFADTLKIDATPGDKNGRLISLTRAVGGDAYLAGSEAASAYLDPQRFTDAGIKLLGMTYHNPEYPQIHGHFMPRMGVIDALMNCAKDARRLIAPDSYTITELN